MLDQLLQLTRILLETQDLTIIPNLWVELGVGEEVLLPLDGRELQGSENRVDAILRRALDGFMLFFSRFWLLFYTWGSF